MSEPWRDAVRKPGWQLVLGGLVLALAFPSRVSGTAGLVILLGAVGVGVALLWPRLPMRYVTGQPRLWSAIVLGLVAILGIDTFWDTLTLSPDWQMGDWGPQHAALARALDSLPGWDLPSWNQVAATGDSPFELYPKLAYLVTGHVAIALGLERDLPLAYMIVAVLVHLAACVLVTAMAMRIAPRPIALAVGMMCVVESGAVSEGGPVDIFRWALLHSALALACVLVAMHGVASLLERPRLRAAAVIWIATAIATIAHPTGLIVAGAACVALLAVALLAHDVPPRRAGIAIVHLGLGVALGAAVWMPLATRILEYAQHFPNRVYAASHVLETLLRQAWPTSAFGILVYGGFFGIIAALWSRRAVPVFLATMAIVLMLGTTDAPWIASDLAPGLSIARLGTVRLVSLARPFIAMCAAYGFAVIIGRAIHGWRDATRPRQLIAAAVVAILAGAALRELPTIVSEAQDRAFTTTRELAPDPTGRARLVAWANERARELRPDAWGRALFETDTHEHFHLTALTGLPTFHMSPQPQFLLRERIEDTSEASLRRFNVRWIVAREQSPTLGDPATEIALGSYRIRELAGWDGQFARIERGTGTVRTTRLDDTAVTIEVTGTEPVLVALGTGYYPRWRARHASGAAVPVYALPTIPDGRLHVVSAWVAPGTTTFTCDGPLPSDGKGTPITLLALVVLVGGVIAWRIPRVRRRALRRLAALRRRRLPGLLALAPRVLVPLALVLLFARGCLDAARPAGALELGTGLRGSATVEAKHVASDAWETCAYSRLTATYECDGLLVAYDSMTNLVNDAPPSWNFNTPGIHASAHIPGVEMRVRADLRLAGRYWMAASEGDVRLTIDGEAPRTLGRAIVDYADRGERTVELRAEIPTTDWAFTFVREATLQPPRAYLAPPPLSPP